MDRKIRLRPDIKQSKVMKYTRTDIAMLSDKIHIRKRAHIHTYTHTHANTQEVRVQRFQIKSQIQSTFNSKFLLLKTSLIVTLRE